MSITLDLRPEVVARAQERASAHGVAVTEYLESMLDQMLPATPPSSQRVTPDEFERIMDELAEGSDDETPPPILSRADIYADHD